jgi:hypothetical protein
MIVVAHGRVLTCGPSGAWCESSHISRRKVSRRPINPRRFEVTSALPTPDHAARHCLLRRRFGFAIDDPDEPSAHIEVLGGAVWVQAQLRPRGRVAAVGLYRRGFGILDDPKEVIVRARLCRRLARQNGERRQHQQDHLGHWASFGYCRNK